MPQDRQPNTDNSDIYYNCVVDQELDHERQRTGKDPIDAIRAGDRRVIFSVISPKAANTASPPRTTEPSKPVP